MCLNLHNQFDLSDTSALTLCLSVSLWTMTLRHFFSSLVSFSSQSHNSTLKSVFALFATSHKDAFVQRIHQEIIQISCTQLGLYISGEGRVICIFCCVASPQACEKRAFVVVVGPVCEAHGMQMITSLTWHEHHVWANVSQNFTENGNHFLLLLYISFKWSLAQIMNNTDGICKKTKLRIVN